MYAIPAQLHPDPAPPARVAHVVVPYTVTFRDGLVGRLWTCRYPVVGHMICRLK